MYHQLLQSSLQLPCGVILKNRLAKAAMSDSLGDGEGNPTAAQIRLYERWAEGGAAVSMIGEVQFDPGYPEKPGNLVLGEHSNNSLLKTMTQRATRGGAHLWPQIGHAGALSYGPVSSPRGPSALDLQGLQCSAMTLQEIRALPHSYATAASHAKSVGFTGIHLHAGHGFLLSQFLSPLFNHRSDAYGGSVGKRSRIVLDIIEAVRAEVGPDFPLGIRINSSDQIEGGVTNSDALALIQLLDKTSIDLIDLSGGTYFPGAKNSSDSAASGPYFIDFARTAKQATDIPIMVTGGFKSRQQAAEAIETAAADMIGLARAMVLLPDLPNQWMTESGGDPEYPRFFSNPPGGITAWYTMRLTALGEDKEVSFDMDLPEAIELYEQRDAERSQRWNASFAEHE